MDTQDSDTTHRRTSHSPSAYRSDSSSRERASMSPRRSLSEQISAIGARLGRVLTQDGDDGMSTTTTLVNDKRLSQGSDSIAKQDRSVSRGRDAFQSSGRGGIGNIRRSSVSTDTRPIDGPDDFSPTRGREPAVNPDRQVFSVGRGGAGNIRSPSRDIGPDHPQTASILSDHAAASADYERQVRKLHAEANPVHSSGRGGLGNISASRSRSKGPSPALHSTGRGGAGNIQYGDGLNADILDQEERRKHAHGEGMHSTGRGGVANLTSSRGPSLEIHGHHTAEFESSGRGGAGNIRSRSASRDPSGRTPSREKHGIAALWNKVSHPQYNSRPSDQSVQSVHSDAAGHDGGTLSPRND